MLLVRYEASKLGNIPNLSYRAEPAYYLKVEWCVAGGNATK